MTDKYGRRFEYLRVSVTDRCNYRCIYCMPESGVSKLCHADTLSFEEIEEIVRECVSLGVKKVRITGGEPLVRRGITALCKALSAIEGLDELTMTTNASLLAPMAQELKNAGIDRINISLDTLRPDRFAQLTRNGTLCDVLSGIRAALAAGMTPVKLNTVLIGGFNDDEIEDLVNLTMSYPIHIRFIELMPIGHALEFGKGAFLPVSEVLERVPALVPEPSEKGSVAKSFALPGAVGKVGLISPLSNHFCGECDRLRLTSDGKIKPCLHSPHEVLVRGLHGGALREALSGALFLKPQRHVELSHQSRSQSARDMNAIGG